MSRNISNDPPAGRRFTIDRTFQSTLTDVWALWTTSDGIESWWGPEGFTVTVRSLDLQAGGRLQYTMTATAAPQVAFMHANGMPIATEATITYSEVTPMTRLAYVHLVDFVPDVAAYDVATVVELVEQEHGVRLLLTLDPMHDPMWTERAIAGWQSELGKLESVIASHAT